MSDSYGFGCQVPLSYTDAISAATVALKEEGFGVLTEIDVQATTPQHTATDMMTTGMTTTGRRKRRTTTPFGPFRGCVTTLAIRPWIRPTLKFFPAAVTAWSRRSIRALRRRPTTPQCPTIRRLQTAWFD